MRLALGKDVEIAAARFGCIGEKKADFEGDHGTRIHVKVLIDAPAVLVEAEARTVFFECLVRFCRGCHGHVGVVELDVPAQNAPHFGKCFVPVEQGQEVVVLAYEVVVVDARCGTFAHPSAFFFIHAIYCDDEIADHVGWQGIRNDEIAIPFEFARFFFCQTIIETFGVHCLAPL